MQYTNIVEYMMRSREERRAHLNLEEACLEIGGYSKEYKALLAHHLRTTIPFKNGVDLCHGCHNNKCSNPNHLYWGTRSDNMKDLMQYDLSNSIAARAFKKYGIYSGRLNSAGVS